MHKKADEWEAKEFLSYGELCPQFSPHTVMKSLSLDRELEVLQRPEASWGAPRTLIPVKGGMRHAPRLWWELHILMFIMNILLKTDFCHWERSWDEYMIAWLIGGLGQIFLSALHKALKIDCSSCLPSAESSDVQ